MNHQLIDAPWVWEGERLRDETSWSHELTAAEILDLESAAAGARELDPDRSSWVVDDFELPVLGPSVERWKQDLEDGRGFVLVRGLPVDRLGLEQAADMYWGIGLHLGTAVSQNAAGDLIGHVRDTGDDPADPSVRLYKTRARQAFHVDGADIIGLLCLRESLSGGESLIASSAAVHNEILRRRPDLVDRLYDEFCWHNHQQAGPDGPDHFRVPLCSSRAGRLRFAFAGWYIREAQELASVPPMTPDQVAVIDLFDEISEDPRVHLAMDFRPGDMQFLNNSVLLHSREEYVDHPEPDRRRHLLRLWLRTGRARSTSSLDEVPTHGDTASDWEHL